MRIHAFNAWRPRADIAGQVASTPYDTVDTAEALALADGNPMSFLHINRPEIDLPEGTDLYSDPVYAKAAENFKAFQEKGWIVKEDRPMLYLYAQTMGDHTQTGIVCCAHIDDYINDVIKKHEFTRKDKEDDRTRHTATINGNIGPVFIAYRDVQAINDFLAPIAEGEALYDFVAEDDVRHQVWLIEDTGAVEKLFEGVPTSYIADGHHRSASAVRVGSERRKANPNHTGEEEYNWFLSVIFPASELKILPYNRAVQDLNGLSEEDFLAKVKEQFTVTENPDLSPTATRTISMYVGGKWYGLSWPEVESDNPVEKLDVSTLQNRILTPLLAVDDPRTSTRIKFVGGIRGPEELSRLVDTKGFAVGFSMYPTTIDQLMSIADAGQTMPPKSTWFEPKLRTGLLSHELD
jgi:uncharacterized protein (DUF1015 family)